MPLTSPDLDDRTFEEIIEEAKRLIPRYAPEWTDWNEHDPGITLIHLFAWLTEMILFRLNQVPDKNFIEFLKLIGVELKPAAPARADLTFTLAEGTGSAVIPMRTPVGLEEEEEEEPTVFETDEPLVAVETALKEIQVFDGAKYTLYTDANSIVGEIYPAFGPKAAEDSALYLGFNLPFPASEVKLTVYLYLEDLISAGSHCETDESQVYPPAELAWEYYNGSEWQELNILKDSTIDLMKSGSIYFNGPGNIKDVKWGESQTDDLYWLRCRVKKTGYEVPPRIDSFLLNTVSATSAETIEGEILGDSDGTPNQTFTLMNTPVMAGTLVLQVDEGDGWKTWQGVDDFSSSTRDDQHYVLNRLTGDIQFGDGTHGRIPLPEEGGNNIMALEYRFGGGKRANVGSNTITSLETSVPGIEEVTNHRPAYGGKDEESAASAKERGPMELKTRQRAVTEEDFQFLALETPGVRVRRAKALPLFHPDFPCCKFPGAVTVIIVPESKDPKPLPSEGMIKTVCQHLNKHRLLTNEVYVTPPQYVKIKIQAEVIAKPHADSRSIERELARNLTIFFHPLHGGPDDQGWEFGGDIYFSDVYKEILKTKGVERIESLFIYKDDEKQDECKNVIIPGICLLYSEENEHQLDVRYERV
jgi:hypothetical protein